MGLQLHHLEEGDVRAHMAAAFAEEWDELEAGGQRGKCYGKDLTAEGWHQWSEVMPLALDHHDDDWLAAQMAPSFYWRETRPRRTRSGMTSVRYNKPDALRQLCQGEFNIAYIRGLARALIIRGESQCIVYRAGEAAEPRSECSAWEGQVFELEQVLAGHRARYWPAPGNPTAWSLPSGPSCHHSIRSL